MVISVFLFFRVKVNYDLSSYLPKDVPSTVAIEKMGEEFEQAVPNTEVGYPIKNLAGRSRDERKIAIARFCR